MLVWFKLEIGSSNIFSRIFAAGDSNETGLYDGPSSADFPGFNSGIILSTFHRYGIIA